MGIVVNSMQFWALSWVGLGVVLAIAAIIAVFSHPKAALVLFASACVCAVVAGAVLMTIGSEEVGPSGYSGLKEAVARDPELLPRARLALADGKLTNVEATGLVEQYNADMRRRRIAAGEATKRQVVKELGDPEGTR